jgi:hypothetical protein
VTRSPFLIVNGDVPLFARIHRANDDLLDRQPAVIVTGSSLTVKEQMPDRYAYALAERGYTAVTFDFAGFGASGGAPRQVEIPARKIADSCAAARYVSTLSFVRPGAVGHLAICASAQYALRAIADGAPIASFVSVAGWYHDTASVAPFYGGADGVAMRIARARTAFDEYLRSGEVRTVPAYENGNDRAGMFIELDYYSDADRGPRSRSGMAQRDGRTQLAVLAYLRRPLRGLSRDGALAVRAQRPVRAAGQCQGAVREAGRAARADLGRKATRQISTISPHRSPWPLRPPIRFRSTM